jgi:hypothetical protein
METEVGRCWYLCFYNVYRYTNIRRIEIARNETTLLRIAWIAALLDGTRVKNCDGPSFDMARHLAGAEKPELHATFPDSSSFLFPLPVIIAFMLEMNRHTRPLVACSRDFTRIRAEVAGRSHWSRPMIKDGHFLVPTPLKKKTHHFYYHKRIWHCQ